MKLIFIDNTTPKEILEKYQKNTWQLTNSSQNRAFLSYDFTVIQRDESKKISIQKKDKSINKKSDDQQNKDNKSIVNSTKK